MTGRGETEREGQNIIALLYFYFFKNWEENMNRVYKIVWSKAKNAYVVTSELAKNHTKNASGKMVKTALTAAVGMGVLMGGYMADAAPATNPSGDGPGIAIGTGSSSQKVDSTAVGKNAKTTGERALAVGYDSIADADSAMAVGNGNKAMAGGSLAVGARNIAQGMGGLAIGENNTAEGDDSAAVGHSNKVHAMGTYAFGLQNTVWKMYSQAYGMNNIVSEVNSFAYGNSNQVGSMNSFAFGGGNLNTARWAVTVGNTNKVGGEHSFAAGFYNTIGSTSKDAVAIGQNARVGVSNFNVATTIDPTTGKITAVYNGEVDATNSVAIGHEANVMALNSVALGENTGVTKDGKNGTAIGGEASVKAENGTAAGFKATVRAKSGVALGASSFVDAEGGIALGRNSVAERKSGRAGYDFTTGAVSTVNDSTWKATDGAVSVGSSANTRQITGVAAGTEDTDAVNVAQIKGLAKKIVTSTADYRLVKNASSADGSYTVDTNGDIDLTVEDKNHAGQKETVKLKDIASKSKLDDVINKGLQFDANVGGVQTNKLGSKITVKGEGTAADTDYSGENLKTFITQDPAGNTTIDVKMNKNLKVETVVATGENGKDGKIGINGKDGQTTNISVTRDGKPGVDGAPGTTTTRIVYEKPDGTKEEVATLNDGMKYGGDTGAVIKKKLNEQVNVVGGITDTNKLTTEDNLGVVSDGSNNLKVRLAKALKGLESVTTGDTVMNNSGVTINNGAAGNPVSLTKNGLDNGGNKITNVAAGVNGTDAVNVNQLNTVAGEAAKHTTVKAKDSNVTITERPNASGGTEYTIGLGDKVTLGTDPTKQVSIDGTTGIIKAGDKVTIDGTTGNIDAGKVKINGKDGTVNGLTNKTWDPNNITSGQAATEDQLKAVDQKITNTSEELTKKGMDFAGNDGEFHRNLGDKVTIKGEGTKAASEYSGENIRTFADTNGNVVVKMDKNLKTETIVATGKDGKNGKIGINGNDGQTTNISVTSDGKPGVDGAPGTTTTRIVYEKPDGTKEEVATLNDGMKYGGDTGNVIKKKLNEQVNVVGGITDTNKLTTEDNLGVVSDGNNNLKVRMAKDLKGLNSVTTNTLTVGDVKIDNSGINAGNKKITNVAAGDVSPNSTDAVNGGQLWKTNQTINNIGGAVNELGTRVNRVGAGAAALAALHPLDFDPDDKWDVAAGYGNYKDAHAVSVGAFYRPNEDTMFSVGGSFGGGENMVNAGVSVKLGQGNHVSTSRVALAKEVEDLKAIVKAQSAEIKAMRGAMQSGTSVMKDVNFPDVPKDHWAYSYVKSLADRGLLEGYPDGEFKGDRTMTRYEFAAIIYRALQNGAPIDSDMAKAIGEFDPEINRIKDLDRTRVDRISGKDNDRHKVERVRVNNESNKEKGDYRDVYGSHISPEA